jgi:hypothetical protein
MPPAARHTGERQPVVVWNHAWRSWKGIRLVLAAAGQVSARMVLAGVGRERGAAQKAGQLAAVDAPGQVPYEQMRQLVATAAMTIDLTGASPKYRGHYNRSTIEPMLLGTPVLTRATLVEPYSPIPRAATLTWTPDMNLAEVINFYMARPALRQAAADAAYEWATGFFTDEAAVADLTA